ncbi:hypothetical protein TUM4644_37190 [Shewanella colwelliana]|nr:hypothetical protein TUM4644_37190 [Shewanella colwelliana]
MNKDPSKIHFTKFGLCFYSIIVLVMFYGFAQSTLSPDSALGALTTSTYGLLAWSFLVASIAGILELVLKKYGIKTLYHSK